LKLLGSCQHHPQGLAVGPHFRLKLVELPAELFQVAIAVAAELAHLPQVHRILRLLQLQELCLQMVAAQVSGSPEELLLLLPLPLPLPLLLQMLLLLAVSVRNPTSVTTPGTIKALHFQSIHHAGCLACAVVDQLPWCPCTPCQAA
jgi:hypothetical protein